MPSAGAMHDVLVHLADTLDRLLVKSATLRKSGTTVDIALFGPMLGRAIIEVSFTAIVSRFDPFRVLAIRKSQLSASYDPKTRNPLAFTWQTDVQGDEKGKTWDERPSLKDLQRALLCQHFSDIFWEEAFTILLDSIPANRGKGWMSQLTRIEPEAFAARMRYEANRLYSELSKGIHHEFVIPLVSQFDPATVGELITRSWQIASALGLTACYSPVTKDLNAGAALTYYEQAQEELYA